MLYRNLGFTFVAVLALGIGVGINTAVFTAYKAMVTRSIDGRDPSTMVNLALIRRSGAIDPIFSYSDYRAYRDHLHSFGGVIAQRVEHLVLSNVGGSVSQRGATDGSLFGKLGLLPSSVTNTELVSVFAVSQNYFSVLGVAAQPGRAFNSIGVGELAARPCVLISENYWRSRFGGDPGILGKVIRLNGAAFTIVGVTPRDFVGTNVFVPAFWLPLSLDPLVHSDPNWLDGDENHCCRLFARLARGATISRAQAEITLLANRLRTLHEHRSELGNPVSALVWRASPFPLPIKHYAGLRFTFLLIMIAAAMVLAVACANVASLQLARTTSRQNELGMRLSLGASRMRLIRQLLTESALLALFTGALAVPFTWAFTQLLATELARAIPADMGTLIFHVTPDFEILAYVFAISLTAGVLFGFTPAFESSRSAVVSAFKANAGTSPARSRRMRDFLIAAQVAISLVLLVVGSMFIHSAIRALKANPGYESKHVICLDFQFPDWSKYTTDRKTAITRALRNHIAALPGVIAVTSAQAPDNGGVQTTALSLTRNKSMTQNKRSIVHYSRVQANYFQELGIPLLFGQNFHPGPGQAQNLIIVSESASKELWPGETPIGRTVILDTTDEQNRTESSGPGKAYQVIGVARDIRSFELDGSETNQVYLPLADGQLQNYPILIRTNSEPAELINTLAAIGSSITPDLEISISTLDEMLHRTPVFVVSSFAAALAFTIGLLGLLLASMGIYGTVSYIVALRTREVGIRMAIGAKRRDILSLILRDSTRPVFAGLLVGAFLAVAASYFLKGVLYSLDIVDTVSFVSMSLLFLVIALLAAYPPSRRATRVEPIVALRYE